MKPDPVPKLEDEIAYAVEAFEDDYDRKPNEDELKAIKAECQEKVDSAQEAYDEYKASGAFECAVCDRTHYGTAPRECRQAYNSDRF